MRLPTLPHLLLLLTVVAIAPSVARAGHAVPPVPWKKGPGPREGFSRERLIVPPPGRGESARAPLAAFTLGRLLLENLRQPADAARAFELARSLAGGSGALAEDALAREVEAWRAAGDANKATARAQRYQALYPNGTHTKQVLRAGEPLRKP